MKKIYAFVFSCLILGAGCTSDNDGLTDRVDQLEKEVNGIKSKTVIEIKKEGEQLVIVYSNGTSESIPFPQGIPGATGPAGETGAAGTAGKDGVGIKSITYDENSGILKITLTNEEVSEFKIIANGSDWKAVLIGDTNGRMFVTEALLGAVPVIKAGYNADFQLTSLESNVVREMQVRKKFGVTMNFANGVLDNYVTKTYAQVDKYLPNYILDGRDLNGDGIGLERVEALYPVHKGAVFRESNGDGTYTYYRYNTQRGTQYVYFKYEKALLISSDDPEYYNWEIIREKENGEFYYYSYLDSFNYNANQRVFPLNSIITFQKISAGDVESTSVMDVETDAQGRITRQYDAVNTGGQPTGYQAFEYSSSGQVKTTKNYVKDSQGQWVANGTYETFTYDANNHLISTVRTYADGTTREIQKAVFDKNGNPTEIWAWTPVEQEYYWGRNPETGATGYYSKIIRPAGLNKVAILEYDYTYKNFLGNTITALIPQLEGYKVVNALKRVTAPNSFSFANIEYKDFNEYGYPGAMLLDATDGEDGVLNESMNLYLKLNYIVKSN
jgi:hypothetical protein